MGLINIDIDKVEAKIAEPIEKFTSELITPILDSTGILDNLGDVPNDVATDIVNGMLEKIEKLTIDINLIIPKLLISLVQAIIESSDGGLEIEAGTGTEDVTVL